MRIALLNLMVASVITFALLAQENDDARTMPLATEEISELDASSSTPTKPEEIAQDSALPITKESSRTPEGVESPSQVEAQEIIQAPALTASEIAPTFTEAPISSSAAQTEPKKESAFERITKIEASLGSSQEPVTTVTPVLQLQEASTPQETAVPPIPAAPKPTESAPVEAEKLFDVDFEEVDPEASIGFDTLGLEKPSGNWLFKRIWWEKAEARYEKIRGLVDQVMDLRMQFLAKRSEVDNKILDPFYIEQSINQGQLEEIVGFLINELKRERERDKSLSPQERQLYETLAAEKRSLEQLRLDVESIRTIDIALDDALTALMQQVNACRSYENKSWELFKDIAKVLDHEQARTLYYNMNTYLDNIKNIHSYLKNTFSQHFDGLITTIQQNITRIKTTMSALQEKGVNLRQQMITISDQEAALEKQSTPTAPQQAKDLEEDEEEEPKGFIALTWSYVTGFFKGIWDLLTFWRY